jgi:hypothetical protein
MPETLTPAEAFVDEALSEAILKAVNYKAWDCPEDSLVVSPYFNMALKAIITYYQCCPPSPMAFMLERISTAGIT